MKPYYFSADEYLKQSFGKKMYRLSLDGGMTCPNRDGSAGIGGCVFCSQNGSGDFSAAVKDNLTEQIETAKLQVKNKLPKNGAAFGYMAYFQSFTNTYAPVEVLEDLFTSAILHPDIEALIIATRPDCLPEATLDLLEHLATIKPVYVELGFQSAKPETIAYINRCYPNEVFEQAVTKLNKRQLPVTVHCILGLPNETLSDMQHTIDYVCSLGIHGIKLQLLHILRNTKLAADYPDPVASPAFACMKREDYIDTVLMLLQRIPSDIVIYRLTGDGPKSLLIAPLWSGDKKSILNELLKEMKLRNIVQGELSCNPNH